MSSLTRFSVSLDQGLLERFDELILRDGYPTRSKAISDLIRDSLIRDEWQRGDEVAGVIVLVYDHHKRGLSNTLTHTQHDYHEMILSTQHIHLDHDNCLEIVIVRGRPDDVSRLASKLKTIKGVKHASLSTASTGKHL